jgi:hypothetical protein
VVAKLLIEAATQPTATVMQDTVEMAQPIQVVVAVTVDHTTVPAAQVLLLYDIKENINGNFKNNNF